MHAMFQLNFKGTKDLVNGDSGTEPGRRANHPKTFTKILHNAPNSVYRWLCYEE